MIGECCDAPAWLQARERRSHCGFDEVEFVVDFDADRRECAHGRVTPASPGRCRHRGLDDVGQVSSRVQWPGLHDCGSDAVGMPLAGVVPQEIPKLSELVGVDDKSRIASGARIHAHVQRGVIAVRESAFARIQLVAADAEIEQHPHERI